jgi:predicted ATPase
VGGLPLALTRFVGRSGDLERLVELIEDERLVTLTGPGGCGKTRLAIEVSRDAERRGKVVWLAELAPLRDGRLVPEAVAAAVGVETGPDPLDDLLAQSSALNGLLVLDNCEHLLDACAALIDRLLAAACDIRILTTSREPLGLPGQQEWPVRTLAVPDVSQLDREQLAQVESVQLLLDRARAVRPNLEVGDDVTSVVSICRALDGIPLAIELAAGRLRSLSLPDLAARLDDQLTVLAGHRSAGLDGSRHQTLRTTLDWSYNLLTDQQQTLARRLSVFAGGFRLDAVDAVCGSSQVDVLDGIDELVAKSLVTFDGATARYRLLEPLRQYFADRLDETGATQAVQQAHAEWVGGLCDLLGTGLLLEDQRACSIRLGEEAGNIEIALCWAYDHDPSLAVRIVGSLGLYWFTYDQANGRRWCQAVIDAATGVVPLSRAAALLSAGMVAQNDAAWDPAIAWLREALAIYRAEDETVGEAASLFYLGRALDNRWRLDDHDERDAAEAIDCFEEGLRLFTQLGVWIGAGWCQIFLAFRALDEQDLDRAEKLSRHVIVQCNSAGVRHPVGQAFCNLAIIAHLRGHHDTAAEFLENAIAVYRDLNDPWQLAGLLVDLAAQAAIAGRQDEALQALAESTRLDAQIGKLPGRSYVFGAAAVAHLARGQTNLATLALGAFDAHPMRGTLGTLQVEAVDETRARLDPTEVAAATATARHKSLDELIDELIIQPAMEAAV